jgi:hypothetical protein
MLYCLWVQAIQLILSHAGVESEERALERKLAEIHAEQEQARELHHGFVPLRLPGSAGERGGAEGGAGVEGGVCPATLSASSGGAALWCANEPDIPHEEPYIPITSPKSRIDDVQNTP